MTFGMGSISDCREQGRTISEAESTARQMVVFNTDDHADAMAALGRARLWLERGVALELRLAPPEPLGGGQHFMREHADEREMSV